MSVSVCIPTYNQSLYLELAVRSAYNQTLKPDEIIVSNDCSTDDTKSVLDKLQKEIPTLKVIYQPLNLGIAKNVDTCLRAASSDYIIRLDSDDLLKPRYAETLVRQMELFPEAGYAHAAVQEIDQYGNKTRIRNLMRVSGYQSGEDALKLAIKGYKVAANIILFRRQALEKVNFVSCKANFAEDYYMVTSISVAGFGNIYLNEILSNYRVWSDSAKVRQKRKMDEIIGFNEVITDVIEPAFKNKNWNIASLKKMRENLAINHANCLGWDNYNRAEKEELLKKILELSDSRKVKFMVWIYMNKFGFFISNYNQLIFNSKSMLKRLIILYRKN